LSLCFSFCREISFPEDKLNLNFSFLENKWVGLVVHLLIQRKTL